MTEENLVDVCTGCKSAKKHNGSKNWSNGGTWGDACGFCGSPLITCRREDIDEAYESGQRY